MSFRNVMEYLCLKYHYLTEVELLGFKFYTMGAERPT